MDSSWYFIPADQSEAERNTWHRDDTETRYWQSSCRNVSRSVLRILSVTWTLVWTQPGTWCLMSLAVVWDLGRRYGYDRERYFGFTSYTRDKEPRPQRSYWNGFKNSPSVSSLCHMHINIWWSPELLAPFARPFSFNTNNFQNQRKSTST